MAFDCKLSDKRTCSGHTLKIAKKITAEVDEAPVRMAA